MLCEITPVGKPGQPVDPDFGQPAPRQPAHPIVLPPLPGIWPKPGEPSLPIEIPPGEPGHPMPPIFIPEDPNHPMPPIAGPPATIWPPLPPDLGFGNTGKVAILVWIVGVGHRWAIVDLSMKPTPK